MYHFGHYFTTTRVSHDVVVPPVPVNDSLYWYVPGALTTILYAPFGAQPFLPSVVSMPKEPQAKRKASPTRAVFVLVITTQLGLDKSKLTRDAASRERRNRVWSIRSVNVSAETATGIASNTAPKLVARIFRIITITGINSPDRAGPRGRRRGTRAWRAFHSLRRTSRAFRLPPLPGRARTCGRKAL